MILQVELENIKSYELERFSFTPGLNAIIGENGAGKTSIVEAIGFVLFDSLPYKISEFLRRGAKKGRIKVRFLAKDGRVYEAVRKISESGTVEYYLNDPETGRVAEGREVVEWIRNAFGIESDSKMFFENAIGVLQGKMTSQFLEPPSVRDRIFSPLIGVESYKKAFEKSREYENMLQDKLSEVEKEIYGLQKELEQKEILEREILKLRKRKEELEKELENRNSFLENLERELKKIEKIKEEITGTEVRIREIISSLNHSKSEFEKAEKRREEIEKVEKEIKELEKDYREYVELEEKITRLKAEERELSRKNEKLSSLKTELATLKSRLASLNIELKEIEENETVREKILPLAKKENELVERIKSIEIAEAEIKQLTERLEELQNEIEQTSRKIAESSEKKKKLLDAEDKLKKVENADEKYESILKKLTVMKSERRTLLKEFEMLRANKCPILEIDCSKIAGKRDEVESKIQDISSRINALENALEKAKSILEKKQTLESFVQKLRGEINTLKGLEYELEAKNKMLSGILEKVKERKEETKLKDKLLADYEKVKGSNDRLSRIEALISRKDGVLEEIKKLKERTSEIEKEIKALEPVRERYKGLMDEIDRLSDLMNRKKPLYQQYISILKVFEQKPLVEDEIINLRSKINELENELRKEQEKMEKLAESFNPEDFDRMKTELMKVVAERGRIEGELKEIVRNLEEGEIRLKEFSEKEREFGKLNEEKKRLEDKKRFIRDLRDIFRLAIPEITRAYVEAVSVEANRIFCEIMGDYGWELRWTEDFGIRAKYRGRDIDFAQMSGGEQMSAAISIRLALLSILSTAGVAFFDEPTQNMDELRRRNLATQLSRIDGFKQIFVISHDDTFEEMVENAVKIEKENGVSKVRS